MTSVMALARTMRCIFAHTLRMESLKFPDGWHRHDSDQSERPCYARRPCDKPRLRAEASVMDYSTRHTRRIPGIDLDIERAEPQKEVAAHGHEYSKEKRAYVGSHAGFSRGQVRVCPGH